MTVEWICGLKRVIPLLKAKNKELRSLSLLRCRKRFQGPTVQGGPSLSQETLKWLVPCSCNPDSPRKSGLQCTSSKGPLTDQWAYHLHIFHDIRPSIHAEISFSTC